MYVSRLVISCLADTTPGPVLRTPEDAARLLELRLALEPIEVFSVLCLNTRHAVLGYHEVSRGTLDSTLVHPREVFKAAVLLNSASLILSHNHPSGDPAPSSDDDVLTHRLVEAGRILGIGIVDHIVIGHHARFFSYAQHGRIPGQTRLEAQ